MTKIIQAPAMIVQGTAEWHQIRIGKITASRVADVVAKIKSGYSARRKNYMAELIAERLTGQEADCFVSKAMQWGTDHEPAARALYEFETEADIEQVGFVHHPSIARSGASPDGLVGKVGLVEIKCPETATHIATLLAGAAPEDYAAQMDWQMACMPERQWCDFVSYDPRLATHLQLFKERRERDDGRLRELEEEVVQFDAELEETIKSLNLKYGEQLAKAA